MCHMLSQSKFYPHQYEHTNYYNYNQYLAQSNIDHLVPTYEYYATNLPFIDDGSILSQNSFNLTDYSPGLSPNVDWGYNTSYSDEWEAMLSVEKDFIFYETEHMPSCMENFKYTPEISAPFNNKLSPCLPKRRKLNQLIGAGIKFDKQRYLLLFLYKCLNDPKCTAVVWKNKKDGIFEIKSKEEFAELWGIYRRKTEKGNSKIDKKKMTYNKVARSLRYYYKKNIIEKLGGLREYKWDPKFYNDLKNSNNNNNNNNNNNSSKNINSNLNLKCWDGIYELH